MLHGCFFIFCDSNSILNVNESRLLIYSVNNLQILLPNYAFILVSDRTVFCIGFFCRARRPAPFSWRPALLKKLKWRPALLTKKKKKKKIFFFFLNYQSHMAFSSLLPFLLRTHSVDCAVHLLLSHSRALFVSSALFHPFTALIMPFFFSSPC